MIHDIIDLTIVILVSIVCIIDFIVMLSILTELLDGKTIVKCIRECIELYDNRNWFGKIQVTFLLITSIPGVILAIIWYVIISMISFMIMLGKKKEQKEEE